jgi:hypothetical protein
MISSVDAGCKSLISIRFEKIAGAPIGSPDFWEANRNQWLARRDGITDSGLRNM